MERKRLLKILSDTNPEVNEDYTDSDLIEYVTCLKKVHDEQIDESRWWSEWEAVYEVKEGVYLKYAYPRSTGDSTPSELGYTDYGLDEIWEVEKFIVEVAEYR